MIDKQGFRLNVGIILVNQKRDVFWGKRVGQDDAWQFPQGGLQDYETVEEAMYRELSEEIGLKPEDVEVIAVTKRWLRYRLPKHLRRYHQKPLCIGQKQKWFLLRLVSGENSICLNNTPSPEFDKWCWVDYWHPISQVIQFKRCVYKAALQEFESLLFA